MDVLHLLFLASLVKMINTSHTTSKQIEPRVKKAAVNTNLISKSIKVSVSQRHSVSGWLAFLRDPAEEYILGTCLPSECCIGRSLSDTTYTIILLVCHVVCQFLRAGSCLRFASPRRHARFHFFALDVVVTLLALLLSSHPRCPGPSLLNQHPPSVEAVRGGK